MRLNLLLKIGFLFVFTMVSAGVGFIKSQEAPVEEGANVSSQEMTEVTAKMNRASERRTHYDA